MLQLAENRYAGPSEAALLRKQLALDAKDDAELETRLLDARTVQHAAEMALLAAQEAAETARAYSAQVREQKDLVVQRMLRARGLLHPVRRVPDELLSHIFVFVLEPLRHHIDAFEHDKSLQNVPFTCAAVCRRWREAALSTPKLWSCLAFHNDNVTVATSRAWEEYLDMFHSYSKSVKLSIFLMTSDPIDTSMDVMLQESFKALMARCDRLHIRIRCTAPDRRIRGFSEFTGNSLSLLRELTLATYPDPAIATCGIPKLPSMPRLRSLKLDNIWLPWDQQVDLPVDTVFLRPSCEITAAELATVASKLPFVEKFAIMNVNFRPSPPTVIPLPRVKVFEVDAYDSTLGISFDLPVVETATIGLRADEEGDVASQFVATAGLLHLLETSLSRSTLENLTIYPAYDVGTLFAGALRPLTGLRELTLGRCLRLGVEFLQRLSAAGLDHFWICPNLEKLHLGLQSNDEAVLVALSQLVRARYPVDESESSPDTPPVQPLAQLSLVWNSPPPDQRLTALKVELSPMVTLVLWNAMMQDLENTDPRQ